MCARLSDLKEKAVCIGLEQGVPHSCAFLESRTQEAEWGFGVQGQAGQRGGSRSWGRT